MIKYDRSHLQEYFDFIALNPDFIIRSLVRTRRFDIESSNYLTFKEWDRSYKVMQFWDTAEIPSDVQSLIETWRLAAPEGCHILFNSGTARHFIAEHFDGRFVEAYEFCYHPAMQSDFFRLAYLYIHGGLYIDSDERITGKLPGINFSRGNFVMLSPLIREREKKDDGRFTWMTIADLCKRDPSLSGPVCYFNNNAIFSTPRNEIIKAALMRATRNIFDMKESGVKKSIHVMTGPTCLTFSIGAYLVHAACTGSKPVDVNVIDKNECFSNALSNTVFCEYKKDNRNWVKSESI